MVRNQEIAEGVNDMQLAAPETRYCNCMSLTPSAISWLRTTGTPPWFTTVLRNSERPVGVVPMYQRALCSRTTLAARRGSGPVGPYWWIWPVALQSAGLA